VDSDYLAVVAVVARVDVDDEEGAVVVAAAAVVVAAVVGRQAVEAVVVVVAAAAAVARVGDRNDNRGAGVVIVGVAASALNYTHLVAVAAAAAVVVSNVVVVVVVVAYEVRPYRVGVGDSWSWWLEAVVVVDVGSVNASGAGSARMAAAEELAAEFHSAVVEAPVPARTCAPAYGGVGIELALYLEIHHLGVSGSAERRHAQEAGVFRIDVYWLVARKNIDIAAAVAVYDSESVSLAEGLSAVHLTPVNEMFAAHDDRSV
jgi:hypothetical protein